MDISALDAIRIEMDPVTQTGIAFSLILIMLGISLGLRIKDFGFLKERPGLFVAGALAQLIGLPLVTLALIMLIAPPASIALGMIIVACCPGGASSNMFSHFAHANVAFSVALTATASLAAAVLTPVSILFWSGLYEPTSTLLASIGFDPISFLTQTMVLLAVPLATGMGFAHWQPALADRVRGKIAMTGACLLGATALYGSWKVIPVLFDALPQFGPIVIVHNALAFAIGAATGRLMKADIPSRRTLAIEVGIQNSGLALVILLSQLKGLGGAAAVAAAWGIWHLVAGAAIVFLFRQQDRKAGATT